MSAVIKRAPSCRLYFALALVGVLLICLAPARAGEPRLVIHIYKYGELHDTTKLKNFGDFKDILSHKISSISDELSGPVTGLKDLGGLKPFFVVDANDDPANFDGDNDKLAGRWRNAHALEILSGLILWDPRQLVEQSHKEAEKQAKDLQVLAQLVLWGKAYHYGGGVVVQANMSQPQYRDYREQHNELWQISLGDHTVIADVPRRRYEIGAIVLRPDVIERYSLPSALQMYCPF